MENIGIKCPVCGMEMEKGFLQVQGVMSWVKQKHSLTLMPEKGEVFIFKRKAPTFMDLNAFICKSCKNILVDYSDSGYKEG